jgi:hypothetical protein
MPLPPTTSLVVLPLVMPAISGGGGGIHTIFWPNLSPSLVNRVSKGPNRFAIPSERLAADATPELWVRAITFSFRTSLG